MTAAITPPENTDGAAPVSRFFDFAAATARVLRDFPQIKANTVFLNTQTPHETYGHWKAKLAAVLTGQGSHSRQQIQQSNNEDSSYAFQNSRWGAQLKSLVYKPDDSFSKQLGRTVDVKQAQAFGFHHELGHLVVKDAHGPMPMGKPYPENAADGFATMRHLQDNPQDLLLPMVNSWARAYRFIVTGAQTHMTSTSIEAVIADHAGKKRDFATMDGSTLAAAAAEYAHQNAPDEEAVDRARYEAYGRFKGIGKLFPLTENTKTQLLAFAETALKTENRFAFQAGLSMFRPFLHPAGVEINGVTIRLEDAKREELTERFEARADRMGVPSLIEEWKQNVDAACLPAKKTDSPAPVAIKPLKLSLE